MPTPFPEKTELVHPTDPLKPNVAEYKAGIGKFWEAVTSLLGTSGTAEDARLALGIETVDEQIHAAIEKTTPNDADELALFDSVSGLLRRLTFENLKGALTAPLTFRNLLINGGFDVWQRGTTFAPNSSIYTADRWNANNTNVTNSQVAAPAGSGVDFYMRAATTNVSNLLQHSQPLESSFVKRLQGGNATFSINALCSAGTVSAFLRIYKNATANTLLGGSWTLVSEQAITITTSDTRFSVTAAVPSDGSANGLRAGIFFTNAANGITVDYGKAQFEKGAAATQFEYRPYGTELALCQRYYEVCSEDSLSVGAAVNGATAYTSTKFAVQKRAAPTVTTAGVTGSGMSAKPEPSAIYSDVVKFSATQSTAGGNAYYTFSWTASAEL